MYCSIKGTVLGVYDSSVMIEDGNGVGYEIDAVESVIQTCRVGEVRRIYVIHSVSENNELLYGFNDNAQRLFFRELVKCQNMGPRTAMGILSRLSLETVVNAVASGDFITLQTAPGVGRKTAERLIVQLKDQLPRLNALALMSRQAALQAQRAAAAEVGAGGAVGTGGNAGAAENAGAAPSAAIIPDQAAVAADAVPADTFAAAAADERTDTCETKTKGRGKGRKNSRSVKGDAAASSTAASAAAAGAGAAVGVIEGGFASMGTGGLMGGMIPPVSPAMMTFDPEVEKAVAALRGLDFKEQEARQFVSSVYRPGLSVSDLIRAALQKRQEQMTRRF